MQSKQHSVQDDNALKQSPAEIDARYPKPDLGYRYEFEPDEHDGIRECNAAHGFAIVKGLIDTDFVDDLKTSIRETLDPEGDLQPGGTRVDLAFVENSKPLRKLLEHDAYLSLYRAVVQSDPLTIHRSAAIMKMPGAGPVSWHSDHSPNSGPPQSPNDVLNQLDDRPNGFWFYLNGTRPHRAGLAVIEDSHVMNWPGPEGFELLPGGKTFRKPGTDIDRYDDFDIPKLVPLYTDPGDLIVFAARTQHAAFPHCGDEPRFSCAIGFRPGRAPWPTPWELPESAKQFIDELPPHLHHFVEHYTSIVTGWKPDDTETVKAEM